MIPRTPYGPSLYTQVYARAFRPATLAAIIYQGGEAPNLRALAWEGLKARYGRTTVPAALAAPRVVCPYEVDGVRMNLAQLRFAIGFHGDFVDPEEVELTMTADAVVASGELIIGNDDFGLISWDGEKAYARVIRPDGVSVIDVPRFKAKGEWFSYD